MTTTPSKPNAPSTEGQGEKIASKVSTAVSPQRGISGKPEDLAGSEGVGKSADELARDRGQDPDPERRGKTEGDGTNRPDPAPAPQNEPGSGPKGPGVGEIQAAQQASELDKTTQKTSTAHIDYTDLEAGFVPEEKDDPVIGDLRIHLRSAAMTIWNNIADQDARSAAIRKMHAIIAAVRNARAVG